MIDRQHGKVLIECDSCPEVIESQWDDFWPQCKRDGWSSRKIANEWLHGCPRCGVPT